MRIQNMCEGEGEGEDGGGRKRMKESGEWIGRSYDGYENGMGWNGMAKIARVFPCGFPLGFSLQR